MPWKIKCKECGNVTILYVSYNIKDFKQIYIYCKHCGKNTFHEILEMID